MLVTDARTILLPWRESKNQLGPLLDVGVIEASGVAKSESALDPEMWAGQPGAVVILHGVVDRLRCRRTLNTYFFSVEFRSHKGLQRLSGFLLPSRAYLRRKRKEGIRSSRSALEYAEAAGTVFHQVAPLERVLDWQI